VSKSWNRMETWIALVVLGVGGLLAAVAGLHVYTTATAIKWHPEATRVPSVSQEDTSPRWTEAVERARQAVRVGMSEQNLPGVSVAVGVDGAPVWAEGFGFADVDSRTGVTPATRFLIGTTSIPLTSAAAALLLDQGRLTLDERIQTYVPEFAEAMRPTTTLRHVMGHMAGFHTDGGDENPLLGTHCARPVEALPVFGSADDKVEPGSLFRFSPYGWILVSAAIETAAHDSFDRVMRARVFEPLGMTSTLVAGAAEPKTDRATDYFPRYAADPRYGLHDLREIDLSCYAGASAFVSTPSDLVRFALALNAGTLLKPDTVRLLQTPQRLTSGEETGYGLGWDLETVTLAGKPTIVVGHDGDILGGQVSSLMIVRDRGLVVAVTSNIAYAKTAAIAASVADAFMR